MQGPLVCHMINTVLFPCFESQSAPVRTMSFVPECHQTCLEAGLHLLAGYLDNLAVS